DWGTAPGTAPAGAEANASAGAAARDTAAGGASGDTADRDTADRDTAAEEARAAVVALHQAVDGSPDLAVYAGPVTSAGDVEMLPFLHEQAVSITAHRFGTPDHLTDHLI